MKVSAPGQSRLHYSPGIPVRLNVKKVKSNQAYLLIKREKKINLIILFVKER